ncbi:MAG: SPOR domain-containing protein [Candidatus Krumholzibacteriota bacterium]|nr:SPOR domain-containing protein [Candidatus Krumholzibacteriota bacterium]
MRKSCRIISAVLFINAAIILLLQLGCTRSEVSGRVPVVVEREKTPSKRVVSETKVEEQAEELVYDLEDEILEDEVIDKKIENLDFEEKISVDSFTVKDLSEAAVEASNYDTGYRIQVFASSDLGKAGELKNNIMAGTGLAVYIEFEDGMYKVRVGDFLTREDASQARKKLVDGYPDCWIVNTTVRK